MPTAVQRMVRTLRVQSLATENDRALLEAFAHGGDEEAFAEIVRRHGPLVLGVCRRILGNVQDAEDAFQATFLVLAKKATSVAWRESIKNWLHGVACRIAMKARGKAIKRQQLAKNIIPPQPATATPADAWNELRPILDQELQQLPPKYREVLILCYLEGKTRDEAAEQLGWSLGSVKGCLERGREVLRTRLDKRGIALSAALAAGLLSEATAGAAMIAPTLQSATVASALQFVAGSASPGPVFFLAQGALNAMLIAKIKTLGFAMMLVFAATGMFWGVYQLDSNDAATIGVAQVARGQDVPREQRKDGEKKRADFFGMIKAIDLKVGTLTVQGLKDGDTNDVTFNLTSKDLKVESMRGEAMKLTDLAIGLRVHLQLKDQDITAMRVENPNVPAAITSIDVEKRKIFARAERMNTEYDVAPDAKFTINGQAVKMMQVPLEQRVMLTLSFDKKTVLAVTGNKIRRDDVPAPREQPKGDRPVERPMERADLVQGTIVDIDAAKNSINLLTGRGDEVTIQTIAVAKDLKIKVQFADQTFADVSLDKLVKPLQAAMQLNADKKSATALTVSSPTIRGVVKSIDTKAKKLVLLMDGRQEKTYELDPDVTIRNGNAVVQVERLTPGANVNVVVALSLDRQRVVGMTIALVVRRDGDR